MMRGPIPHRQAGSGRARAPAIRRPFSTGPESYWRHTDAELHAATIPVVVNSAGVAASFAAPAGVGEVWFPMVVQVQVQPSLLTVACVAQVWRGVAGITQNLLSQTQNGGYDDLGVTGPPIRAGEQVIVVWEGANPGDTAWALIEGTKTVLEAYSGDA